MQGTDEIHAQRMGALSHANVIRMERAKEKRRLKRGEATVASHLANPPAYMATMTVEELLRAAPGMGRQKTQRLLALARVNPSRRVGGLSATDRVRILTAVRDRYPLMWVQLGGRVAA